MSDASEDFTPTIDTKEKLEQALRYWKDFTFVPNYVKLQDAIDTILTDARAVEARHEYAPRWVVSMTENIAGSIHSYLVQLVPRGQKKLARFYTAGIWRWNSDLETGNFVPPGKVPPARLAESRM